MIAMIRLAPPAVNNFLDSQGSPSDAHSLGAVVPGHVGLEVPGGEQGFGDAAQFSHVIAGIDRP
jgi:hypothetical protein